MSRRRVGANGITGPSSALTAFLRDQGISTRPTNTWRRRVETEEDNAEAEPSNAEAAPSSVEAGPSRSNASPARANQDGYNSDNLDDDEDSGASKKKKKPTKAQLEKEKAKAKAAAAKKRKRAEDDSDYDDEEDSYNKPSAANGAASGPAPDIGSFENCAECGKRFTVTKYTIPRHPPPGYLCHICAKASGKDPFKKPPAAKKRKAVERRQVVNFEDTESVKTLANICIEIISKHIDDVDALGAIGQVNLMNIAKIICKNRRLTEENVKLFYDVGNTEVFLTDATALQPQALMALASFNPNVENLRLDLCGRMSTPVIEHYGNHLSNLTRIELLGPFLVKPEGWKSFFAAVDQRLEGFLITQSPRFDLSCLEAMAEHTADTLTELRLAEVGQLNDEWLPHFEAFKNLTSLDLSFPSESLTDEPVIKLLSDLGQKLTLLDLSGHIALTDKVLTEGIAPHTGSLNTLIMPSLELLTDEGVAAFFSAFKQNRPMRHIDFSRNHALSGAALSALLTHSGAVLEDLNINSWKETPNEILMGMAQYLPQLVNLDLGWCREVDDYAIKSILDGCPVLKSVKCHGCNRVTINCPRKDDNEPPMKKLAILEEREEDKYTHETTLKCWACGGVELPDLANEPKVRALVDGIMQSMSSGRQSEVKAWEEETTACEHTLMLEQVTSHQTPASGLAQCGKCDLKENLWLCLTCGNLGCGRAQFGGIGGNGHGLAHFNETQHPVSVKLGTITAEGTADIYCYQCNDSKVDPGLATHLANFGINVLTQTKTEKSMAELQIEHNLNYDFSMTGDDGKSLEPVFGPGLTGLANLGNSCYMASVIQSLFSLPEFQARFGPTSLNHAAICPEPLPASCLECQMGKLADGLLSGRYSHPRKVPDPNTFANSPSPDAPDHTDPQFQEGLKPTTFKALIGKGHEEFATMRQQDSEEFLAHLLKSLRQDAKRKNEAEEEQPTHIFKFGLEQRLQCMNCNKVRYRVDSQDSISIPVPAKEKPPVVVEGGDPPKVEYEPVELLQCLEAALGTEVLEYACPSCGTNVMLEKQSRFSTFPDVLVIHAKKFQLVNWVPVKLDVPVNLPQDDQLNLDAYIGHGKQENEVELPEDAAPAPAATQFSEAAMGQLQAMGFGTNACQRALLATGNSDAELAMNWLFEHMEDPDLNDPPVVASATTSGPEPSADDIAGLTDMGFTQAQARKALKETGGSMERAVEWLFSHPDDAGEEAGASSSGATAAPSSHPGGSNALPARYHLKAFISHKGTSVHSGHYVAHIKTEKEGWVLFNDEKVVRASGDNLKELKPLAYLYIFVRE
ncbi:hypothetical protein FRC05_010747 [Tulasnella sp. 425]|nr:hypothetical protein FRC05_010747 [Tulasnella sp. 425]